MTYKIIVAGSRSFSDYSLVEKTLDGFFAKENPDRSEVCIISGTASGADRLGERYAAAHGISLIRMPAMWEKYGRAAGPKRNEAMAKEATTANKGVLFAFWDGISRGTNNMIKNAKKYELECFVI